MDGGSWHDRLEERRSTETSYGVGQLEFLPKTKLDAAISLVV